MRACMSHGHILIFATQKEFVEMMRKEAAAKIAREAKKLARA